MGDLPQFCNIIDGEGNQVGGQHPMKLDRDASAEPSFLGMQGHSHTIPKYHREKVSHAVRRRSRAKLLARSSKKSVPTREFQTDSSVHKDDDNLRGKQGAAGDKSGMPLLHGRQPRDEKEGKHQLSSEAQAKEEQQNPNWSAKQRASSPRRKCACVVPGDSATSIQFTYIQYGRIALLSSGLSHLRPPVSPPVPSPHTSCRVCT